MLFSIYSASLIALSSGMALERRATFPTGKVPCILYVFAGDTPQGWMMVTKVGEKAGEFELTATSKFADATAFEWGLPEAQGSFPTLQYDEKEIAYDSNKPGILTLQKRNTKGYQGAAWTAPDYDQDSKNRPTELIIQYKLAKLHYCTSLDGKTSNLHADAGDPKMYKCLPAKIIPRFFYTKGVNTFPQKVKIGLYGKQSGNLQFKGWLIKNDADSTLLLGKGPYSTAVVLTLKDAELNKMTITIEKMNLRKTVADDPRGAPVGGVGLFGFYDKGDATRFEWGDGNPYQIVASDSKSIFMCDNADDDVQPQLRADEMNPMPSGWTCEQVMWIVSAIE